MTRNPTGSIPGTSISENSILGNRKLSRRDLMRWGAVALGGASMSAVLASCARAPAAAVTRGAVDLSFWTHDEAYATFFSEALPLAERATDFSYSLSVTRSGAADLVTKLLAQAIAGTGTPDVAGLEIGSFARLLRGSIAAELLEDLTPLADEFGDDLIAARRAPFSKDGALYALDSDTPMTVYYYRADRFEELGLPLPAEAGTWEEFLAAVTPVSEREGVAFGAYSVGSDLGQVVQGFQFMLLQRGGNLFTADGDLSIETPEAEDALRLITDAMRTGTFTTVTDYYGGSIQTALGDGRILGIVMPSWYASYGIKPNVPDQAGLWRVAELPRFAGGGGRTAVGGGTGFAALRNKPGTTAAVELLRATYLDPAQQVKRFQDMGYLPTLRSVYDAPEMQGLTDEFFGGQDVFEVYRGIVDDAPDMYQSEDVTVLNTVLSGALLRAYRGDVSPSEALATAAADFRGQVQEPRSDR